MKKQVCKIISIILCLNIVISLFTGCSSKKETTLQTEVSDTEENKAITLTYWVPMHGNAAKIMKTYGESEVYKKLEELTGIKIKFIHPAAGQSGEQFNLIIASNDFPDIIEGSSVSYPGGVDKAIDDEVYLKLNDLIDKYAPNFKKLREDPEIAKETITDEGNIWCFPCLQTMYEPPWAGAAIRGDWLEDLGLKMPKTINDWDNVLRRFKTEKGANSPLFLDLSWVSLTGAFSSAYNTVNNFMNVDGKVKYGPIQEEYKQFLIQMNKWYEEGLIDKDFASRDDKNMESMLMNGQISALIAAYGSLNTYNSLKKDKNFKVVAAPYPTLKEGQQLHYRQTNFHNKACEAAITTSCKYPEEAVKWFDYHYSDEGAMLFNYGIEGLSYEMKDGKPEFTEIMTNNPDGLTYPILAWKYKIHIGPYKRDWAAIPPQSEIVNNAIDVWSECGNDYYMPNIVRNAKEAKRYSALMNEINTYVDEMNLKFIMGVEPLENFEKYVEQVQSLGIEEVLAIQQSALNRYLNR